MVFAKIVANLNSSTVRRALSNPVDLPLAHQNELNALLNGVSESPKQWQHWFWVCVAGMVLFIPTIFLNRGRWSPARAKEDETKHAADVAEELRELVGAGA